MKSTFAFIVHSRDRSDLPRKFPLLKFFPNFIFDFLTLNLSPFVVSKITGVTTITGNEVSGMVIGVPMTARQLIENRDVALKRIVQAVNLAKSKGVSFVGLGAMTASLSKGGKDIIDLVPGVIVTTGRTYTIKNIVSYIDFCIAKFNLPKESVRIGIVGAAGGIGSGTAIFLAQKGYKHFLLIDLERKLQNLQKHIENIESHNHGGSVFISHQVSSISGCDIVVTATSAPEVLVKSEDVLSGTIIINDAQPSDVSPEIIKNREDILVIEGGVLHTSNINCHFNFGLNHKTDIFSCLAETVLLAYREHDNHYSIGDFDSKFIKILENDADLLGFTTSCPQNNQGLISDDRFEQFSKYIISRYNKI